LFDTFLLTIRAFLNFFLLKAMFYGRYRTSQLVNLIDVFGGLFFQASVRYSTKYEPSRINNMPMPVFVR